MATCFWGRRFRCGIAKAEAATARGAVRALRGAETSRVRRQAYPDSNQFVDFLIIQLIFIN